jgi:T5orf172 domain
MPSTETQPGYIYILHNPSLRDESLKIGKTTRNPYTRAKELSRETGVAQEYVVAYQRWVMNPNHAEAKIHTYLDRYRINNKREFFGLPLEDAIRAVRRITNEEAQIEQWSGRQRITEASTPIRWISQAGDLFLFTRYKTIFDSQPTIIDVWEARDDNDELLITSDLSLDPNSLMPELSITEDKTFRTGDRLSWVSQSRDGVLDEPPPRTAHIEFSRPVRITAMSVQPHIAPGPAPILFSTLSPHASPELAQVAYQECCKFGLPRSWSAEDVNET